MSHTLNSFVENFSGAPFELYELAEEMVDIEDCPQLVDVALEYLEAKNNLEIALEEFGIER